MQEEILITIKIRCPPMDLGAAQKFAKQAVLLQLTVKI